jgi:hypothetical protein
MMHVAFMRHTVSLFILFLWMWLLPSYSSAEMYVAGMAGYTTPNDLTNVKGTGGASVLSFSDLDLQSSVAYGGKVGYFFPAVNWLGVETEVYNTTPHVKQQPVTVSGFGLSFPLGTQPGFSLRVLTWGINAVVRYPGKTFQPYAGVGLGMFFAHATFQGQSDSDTAPGLNSEFSRPTTWPFSPNINTTAPRSVSQRDRLRGRLFGQYFHGRPVVPFLGIVR